MAVVEEIMEMDRILESEGFGIVAGDLLAEISAGREINLEGAYVADVDDKVDARRVEISGGELLAEAARILRLRLVEPARHLAEADDIASQLSKRAQVAIRFVDEEGNEAPAAANRRAGDRKPAEALADVLSQIANTTPTPGA